MNKRLEAIANGKLQYNSGKPCRSGHISDRYSSNGVCIECLRIQAEARRGINRAAKIKRNNALFASLRDHTFMVRECDRQTVHEYTEILQYATPDVIAQCKQFIAQIYKHTPAPRALTRDDLLDFMDYRGGQVHNSDTFNMSHPTDDDPVLYIIHNSHRYAASECMEVLRNQRLNVKPQ